MSEHIPELWAQWAKDSAASNRMFARILDPDPRPERPEWWRVWAKRRYRRELAAWRERQPRMPDTLHIARLGRLYGEPVVVDSEGDA